MIHLAIAVGQLSGGASNNFSANRLRSRARMLSSWPGSGAEGVTMNLGQAKDRVRGGGRLGGVSGFHLPCTVRTEKRGLWPRDQPPAAPGLPHCTHVGS
jgi:hypothetical protein